MGPVINQLDTAVLTLDTAGGSLCHQPTLGPPLHRQCTMGPRLYSAFSPGLMYHSVITAHTAHTQKSVGTIGVPCVTRWGSSNLY